MAIITHGHLPRALQEGFKLFIEKPENVERRRKTQGSFNRMVESLINLDPETADRLLKEMLKSSNK